MKTKTVLFWICMVCFGWICWNCEPIRSYSEIPEIHFKKLAFEDRWDTLSKKFVNTPILTFSFIDGDGDLGVRPRDIDSISKIHYTWYQKLPDKTYEPFQFLDGSIGQRSDIPYSSVMDKSEAQNKTLKGTIEIEMVMPTIFQGMDTMRIEFYIVDRARNQSIIEYTPDFSILSPVGTEIIN